MPSIRNWPMLLVFLTAWGSGIADDSNRAQTGVASFIFDCGHGYRISVQFHGGDHNNAMASITLPSGAIVLPRVRSGSGARYADDRTEFWNKGDEALFTLYGEQQKRCVLSD